MDCCDKAQYLRLYKHIGLLHRNCRKDRKVKRTEWQGKLKKPSGQFSRNSSALSGTSYNIHANQSLSKMQDDLRKKMAEIDMLKASIREKGGFPEVVKKK